MIDTRSKPKSNKKQEINKISCHKKFNGVKWHIPLTKVSQINKGVYEKHLQKETEIKLDLYLCLNYIYNT